MKGNLKTFIYDEKEQRFRAYVLIGAFVVVLAIIYFAVIEPLENLLIGLGLTIEGMYNPDSFIDLISVLVHFSLLPLLIIVGSYLVLKFVEKSDFELIGMNFYSGWITDLFLGIGVGMGLMAIGLLIFVAFGWVDIIGFAWNINGLSVYMYRTFYIIVSLISVALMEEIFLRGYIFLVIRRSLGLKYSIIITSVIFGLLHLNNSTAVSWSVYVIPFTLTMAGVLFAVSLLSRESLWVAIGLHFAWNIFEYGIFNLNGGTSSLLFVTEINGPAFFVGLPNSSFGPEVGIVGVLMMAIGIYYFTNFVKPRVMD